MSIRQAESSREREAVAHFDTGFGEGAVTVVGGRLAAVELPSPGRELAPASSADNVNAADRRALARWAAELEAYFRGKRLSWTAEEIPLDRLELRPFERRVYATLLQVPAGTTIGYGELAERAGFPRAGRAVGSAMAGNPIPVVVPCHRVIHADGSLGRYGNDDRWKARLLALEGESVGRADVEGRTARR